MKSLLFLLVDRIDDISNPTEIDLQPLYDDFVESVIALCTTAQGDVPAYFTLHYTRLELQEYRSAINSKGAGKKCIHYELCG